MGSRKTDDDPWRCPLAAKKKKKKSSPDLSEWAQAPQPRKCGLCDVPEASCHADEFHRMLRLGTTSRGLCSFGDWLRENTTFAKSDSVVSAHFKSCLGYTPENFGEDKDDG